jgi:hypothetical protein
MEFSSCLIINVKGRSLLFSALFDNNLLRSVVICHCGQFADF